MKTPKGLVCIAIITLLSLPFSGLGQIAEQGSANADQRLIEAAKEIMNSEGSCALISIDDEGIPRVRAMDPFAPEEDLTVWFGTNSKSRKVEWEAFYPDKTRDYLLIEVTPVWMEVLSPPRGISADPLTWQPPIVNF